MVFLRNSDVCSKFASLCASRVCVRKKACTSTRSRARGNMGEHKRETRRDVREREREREIRKQSERKREKERKEKREGEGERENRETERQRERARERERQEDLKCGIRLRASHIYVI